MSPRPDVSDERKQQILAAAMPVFARQGFSGARMDDIAAEAGLSKGALYWYFESKDAIIDALMELFFDRELAQFKELFEADGPANERLRAAMNVLVSEMDELVNFMPVAYEYYATALREGNTFDFFQEFYQGFTDVLTGMIRQGVASGEFRADIDPVLAATMIVSFFEGAIFIWVFNRERLTLKDMADTAMTVMLDGLRQREEGA